MKYVNSILIVPTVILDVVVVVVVVVVDSDG